MVNQEKKHGRTWTWLTRETHDPIRFRVGLSLSVPNVRVFDSVTVAAGVERDTVKIRWSSEDSSQKKGTRDQVVETRLRTTKENRNKKKQTEKKRKKKRENESSWGPEKKFTEIRKQTGINNENNQKEKKSEKKIKMKKLIKHGEKVSAA